MLGGIKETEPSPQPDQQDGTCPPFGAGAYYGVGGLPVRRAAASAHAVEALAHALKLDDGELLRLQRDAAQGRGRQVPGRPFPGTEPHALEVHPAGPGNIAAGNAAPGPAASQPL
ncbi:hypothetical protein GCM10023084_73010 [Streptomyces lacrimifluminis]|uniref:Uncharacterized protein n=1 Tax=Streptomyces lacrimifluminis TaxID=1500077 RepID=A0A917P658_9ACTN|nr:hypothetical protein GCM10012282_71090 [Streptomyces lacrimifluminis]